MGIGSLAQGTDISHYGVENSTLEFHHCDVGLRPGFWRSVGHYPNVFALESLVDEIAMASGKDPLEYRLSQLKDERAKQVLELLGKESGWPDLANPKGIALFLGYQSVAGLVVELDASASGFRVSRMICVADCGFVLNPDQVSAQLEGALIFGLSSVLGEEIGIQQGNVNSANFDTYPILTINDAPEIQIFFVDSGQQPGGVGELGVPLVAPAVCNALATVGRRERQLPVMRNMRVSNH